MRLSIRHCGIYAVFWIPRSRSRDDDESWSDKNVPGSVL